MTEQPEKTVEERLLGAEESIKDVIFELVLLKKHKFNQAEFFANTTPENIETMKELFGSSQMDVGQLRSEFNAQVERCGNDIINTRFPKIVEQIETLFSNFNELEKDFADLEKTKKIWKRRLIMENIAEIGNKVLKNTAMLEGFAKVIESTRLFLERVDADNPDCIIRDGKVSNLERAVYNIAKMPWQEWMLIALGVAGAFFGGVYVGGL